MKKTVILRKEINDKTPKASILKFSLIGLMLFTYWLFSSEIAFAGTDLAEQALDDLLPTVSGSGMKVLLIWEAIVAASLAVIKRDIRVFAGIFVLLIFLNFVFKALVS